MKVEFIIPTYDRVDLLNAMLASLAAQSSINWTATVIIDDKELEYRSNPHYVDNLIHCLYPLGNIRYIYSGERYNDWGHTPREIGKQQAVADYIIMTGDDNYYTPNFVEELVKASEGNPGMIYWDMIHSHYDYQYFKCVPAYNQIDMGAFATRRDLAQQIPLGVQYAADGLFVESFKHMFPNEEMVKINKVLFVHN